MIDLSTAVLALSVAASGGAAVWSAINLRRYRPAPRVGMIETIARDGLPSVTICIPARNEESNIEACVRSVLANHSVSLEVIVHDDQSTDRTASILSELAREDCRVRILSANELPAGWNGKQWGCDRMGRAARGEWLLFTDADVRFEPSCLQATLAATQTAGCELMSTIPRQLTRTWMEDALVPLIHFVMLSYLPMGWMRSSLNPAASAGCGQFLFVRKATWERAGGHATFRSSMHDGIQLPRAIRRAGGRTDLFDGTALVSCRMYSNATQVWTGFTKNAYEGLGSFPLLVFITAIHLLGHVWPWIWLAVAFALGSGELPMISTTLVVTAIAAGFTERIMLARRFGHSGRAVRLHPISICLMTIIQWQSFVMTLRGQRVWKGRAQPS